MAKLLDYNERWDELEASTNPFAIMVMAHLKTQTTRNDPEQRRQWKFHLVKQLYETGFQRQDILELFRFIDWLLVLPEQLEQQFREQLATYEATMSTPYITSIERHGFARGIEQGLSAERALLYRLAYRRFGEGIAEQLKLLLENVHDTEILATIGEFIVDDADGNELLQQVQVLLKSAE